MVFTWMRDTTLGSNVPIFLEDSEDAVVDNALKNNGKSDVCAGWNFP